ncbi:MAG: HAMP domain-containing protein [Proteobacteria bacterium]|nr:HAMP domain-containing protein [Pseudomonadota bacterium]MBU1449997.1 HAMP domain-containing protein [Pseudomonadota bacterium]MBU2469902.1 HAMP domain-containing protein [Pseudomonadota bacterium]
MKPRLSFQGWILGGCLVVVVCTLVFVAVVMERSLSSHMLELVRSSMQREILTVREVVRDRWRPGEGIPAADRLADELGRIVGSRVTLITPQGKVLGDSRMPQGEVPGMVNHADRPEIVQAMAQGEGSAVRYSSTLGFDLMYTALRLDGPNGQKLLVRLALPLSQVQQALSRTRGLVLWAMFLGVLLSIGVAYLVARGISRPVQQLTRTAASIAAGDLSRRFTRYPRHEIGELGRAFDQMADNLQSTIDDITQSRDRLEAILRGMVEGVLVIDNDGYVLLANQALMKMLELKAVPPGRLPSEIMRNADLLEALDEARAGREYVWREIKTLGATPRHLEAHVVRISGEASGPGMVCVLHDITERKRLEKTRRDLVANVSHELRTPLTAVRGAAETLLDGALDSPQYARHFAELILRQSHRLERLVQDLMELARLESGESPPRPRPINAAELTDSVMEAVTDLAQAQNTELERRLPREPLVFAADARQVEQAVLNLLDNAIKYTGQAGRVTLAMEARDQEVIISVSDTGPGIAAEYLPRLFERFFRVDTNRSREMGGTGLGLAIVKHIAQVHHGRVEVDSAPGRGSTFRLILPLVNLGGP